MKIADTKLNTWFERDRAHVELTVAGETIVEWWDDDVWEAIADGTLSGKGFCLGKLIRTRELHESAYEHARELGLWKGLE